MKIRDLFNKYVLSGASNLTKRERMFMIGYYLVPITIIAIITYAFSHVNFIIEVLLIMYVLFIPELYALYYAPEKFIKRFGRESEVHSLFTYQYYLINYSLYVPGLILLILYFGNFFNQLLLSIYISLAFVVPFVSGFFRTDVFNDSSCIMGDEIVLGYHYYYILFSLIVGLFGFYNVYGLLNVNYDYAICLFVLTVIFQILFVVPNWINRVVPFEVRKKEGFILYNVLAGGLYLVISYYIIGSTMISTIPINLSPENIIKNIIIYGIGAIFTILIIRQGKQMGKKEK